MNQTNFCSAASRRSGTGLFRIFFLAGTVLFVLVAAFGAAADDQAIALYRRHCAICHGQRGDGQTPAAAGMIPPPTDFSNPELLVSLTRERMTRSIREGRARSAMAGWGSVLNESQIAGLVEYIRDTLMLAAPVDDTSLGRRIFAKNCSVCHGDRGTTAIWAKSGLTPAPRDFTTEAARRQLDRKRMLFSVTYGRPETAMPAWRGRLSTGEIEAVVSYIRSALMFPGGESGDSTHWQGGPGGGELSPGEEGPAEAAGAHGGGVREGEISAHGWGGEADPEKERQEDAHGVGHGRGEEGKEEHDHYQLADMGASMPLGLTGDAVWGERFYRANCATCHGEEGDGHGPRSDFIYPKPRNLLHPASRHRYNRPHLFEVIARGERGTEMPAWDKVLTDAEIAHLTEYVFRTFIRPGEDGLVGGLQRSTGDGSGEVHPVDPPPPFGGEGVTGDVTHGSEREPE
ncbi:MAG: c-type cytochrome [Magnetococcales bacterium]|nr:c-type cytochrome [Magnetococcales bacterium]MBF0157854.1 c-type cytochrome [Magnetococcales bacterium]